RAVRRLAALGDPAPGARRSGTLPGVNGANGAELRRRDFVARAGHLGLAAAVAAALPVAARMPRPEAALAQGPNLADATLQAFFDTIVPGRVVTVTQSGAPIHPQAIAGVDPEPGAVEADALLLAHDAKIGFDALAPAFLADLAARSAGGGGQFLDLDYDGREAVCLAGLEFSNPDRVVWEAAAAVPFTAFCAAATVENATRETAVGYRVMGHPGVAPKGYEDFSFRRKLNRGITRKGSLP
ncbi:MAG TPA: DUF5987 family protein, partial [Solirubrobacterales bacterium]